MEAQIKTVDSQYIQQHLANERTYLAWIRTAIAISGLGFLVANLHFSMRSVLTPLNNKVAIGIGIASIVIGVVIIILSTRSYLTKRDEINSQTFKAIGKMTVYVSSLVIFAIVIIAIYFLLIV